MARATTQNVYDLELVEGEAIEHVAKRHWILLLYHLAIPIVLIAIMGWLTFYRYSGGRLFVFGAVPVGDIDSFNTVLLIGTALLGVLWFVSRRRKRKEEVGHRRMILVGMAVLIALFAFRYNGGRIFALYQYESAGIDVINRSLIVLIMLVLFACFYLWIDWSDDSLVLTNRRIVHDHRVLFQRHVQDQILVEKIQSTKMRKETYTAYWLDYGSLVVQAVHVGRRMTFEMAAEPEAMKSRLDAVLKSYQGAQSDEQYRSMVETNVYGAKPLKSKPPIALRAYQAPALLAWLFFENPEVEDEKATITWRSHWLFVFASVAVPFAFLLLSFLLLLISIRTSLVVGPYAAIVGIIVMAAVIGWALWRYEDVRNDVLILTPTNISRVEKKPFGPEDRSTAGLGAIQNVSFDASIWGRMIGYGTIDVRTAGSGSGIKFHRIPDPRQVIATIYDYINEFKKGDRERALKDTLMLLQMFHAQQVERGEFED